LRKALKSDFIFKDNKLIGFSTNCEAAIEAIKEKTDIKNKKVVMIGGFQ